MPPVQRKEVLVAAMQDVRALAAILRGVSFQSRATMTVSETGIMVAVADGHTLLASAYLFKETFTEYTYSMPVVEEGDEAQFHPSIEIKLPLLLQALDIFGGAGQMPSLPSKGRWSKGRGGAEDDWAGGREEREQNDMVDRKATALRMSYAGTGYPLVLRLAGDSPSVFTLCELTTFEAEPQIDLPFEENQAAVKIIMKSSWLREALSELDPSCEKITIMCSPPDEPQVGNGRRRGTQSRSRPTFRLKGTGNLGTTVMDYPDDPDVVELADFFSDKPISFSYRFIHISRTLRALQSSAKVSIRMDPEGLLSLQFMIPLPRSGGARRNAETQDNFIEFKCAALADD